MSSQCAPGLSVRRARRATIGRMVKPVVKAVLLDFYLTPSWASRSGDSAAAPRPADRARFAGALARRYSGTFAPSSA